MIGRSEAWLSQVERGIRHVDRVSVLIRLAQVLKVTVEDLIGQPLSLAPNGGVEFRAIPARWSSATPATLCARARRSTLGASRRACLAGAQVVIDLARGYTQQRKDAAAVNMLLQAERIAPEAVRYQVIVKERLRELLRREHRASTPSCGRWRPGPASSARTFHRAAIVNDLLIHSLCGGESASNP
jgi:transcriptional regulator with XRE-family HTH domain